MNLEIQRKTSFFCNEIFTEKVDEKLLLRIIQSGVIDDKERKTLRKLLKATVDGLLYVSYKHSSKKYAIKSCGRVFPDKHQSLGILRKEIRHT